MAVVVLLLFFCYFFHIFHVFLFFFVGHNSSWSSSSSAYHPSSIKTSRHCSTQGTWLPDMSCWHGRVSALARSRPHTDQCPHCQGVKSMVYHVRSVELFMKLLLLRWPYSQNMLSLTVETEYGRNEHVILKSEENTGRPCVCQPS